MPSAITGTPNLSANPTAYTGGANSQLSPVIQTIWSKEILFQAMPVLKFEQFAVKKTELGVQPGLSINFTRYNNLGKASQLVEGVRMQTAALTATQFSITVSEHGYAIGVTELLLNASFDDVMATASRLLGRNMATYLDESARNTLLQATSHIYGYDKIMSSAAQTRMSPFDLGTLPTATQVTGEPNGTTSMRMGLTGNYHLTVSAIKDGVETLSTKNTPRLGDSYVCFVHPHQSRRLRDDPNWINMTQYASPGNFQIGEIGRIDDVVFIESTQVSKLTSATRAELGGKYEDVSLGKAIDVPTGQSVYQAVLLGDNAFGHAISLPVELRDGGIQDFGREHLLAWYAIWGLGLITDQSVVLIETN
ncbi:N4-gp56 family major capsid protein [Streptosporangium sp. NPDC050855]|uniref:N4-gp56 family major capsid protein n=1 Tax=Streptosporangium sp. NPDC050855 TaxID=3366194 RepID=UPI0037A233AD